METPTREWPWPWEGYETVRLFIIDVLPPTRDQLVSHGEAVVRAARTVKAIEDGFRSFHSPYLPLHFRVVADNDRPESQPEHLNIEVRVGRG
jgi:hypothetical protein